METIRRVSRSFSSSDTDCQTVQECLRRTVSCMTNIERCTGSLHFNHSLCKEFVSKYVSRARELVNARQSEIELYSEQCAPTLRALHKTLKEAEFLIQRHCGRSPWVWAAVELVENTSAFAEVILDLRWYTHALVIEIELSRCASPREQQVQDLQRVAMREHEDFHERWEKVCKQLRLDGDREALLSELQVVNEAKSRYLASYLAKKLALCDVREPEPVLVNVSELLNHKQLLGEGSWGRVFKVEWQGMPCALKRMKWPDVNEVIPEEVRTLSGLHHPNIIQLYGHFFDRGTLHLITELMEDSLSEFICGKEWSALRHSPHFLQVALDCMLQIAKGVWYLHRRGMAHRDLKAANVLCKRSEDPDLKSKGYLSVKLADFGLAKADLRSSTYSSLDAKVGSLAWRAPELFQVGQLKKESSRPKKRHFPFKLDVYSFAILCSEILCTTPPFSNAELLPTKDFCAAVMGGELRPKLPENLPPGLADYIKRCWDTTPVIRPDFRDICKRLRHFRDSLLQVNAYKGWELKTQEREPDIQEPLAIDENDCTFIAEEDWNGKIEYDDIKHENLIRAGSGFMSVYEAELKPTSKRVLAKHIEVTLISSDASIECFKREIEFLVTIRHPNLVYYCGATRRAPFVVVTELAEGVTLKNFLATTTMPLPRPVAVRLALHVAHGMARLHHDDVGIIHGELSPDSILVDGKTMTAKVLDFGLLRFRKEPDRHFVPRSFRKAPELHSGEPLRTSVDVFSFGMILYDLLEYRKAKHFWKTKSASKKLINGERPELDVMDSYPRGIHELVHRCWAQNWQERPSFESIVSDLMKVEKGFAEEATTT